MASDSEEEYSLYSTNSTNGAYEMEGILYKLQNPVHSLALTHLIQNNTNVYQKHLADSLSVPITFPSILPNSSGDSNNYTINSNKILNNSLDVGKYENLVQSPINEEEEEEDEDENSNYDCEDERPVFIPFTPLNNQQGISNEVGYENTMTNPLTNPTANPTTNPLSSSSSSSSSPINNQQSAYKELSAVKITPSFNPLKPLNDEENNYDDNHIPDNNNIINITDNNNINNKGNNNDNNNNNNNNNNNERGSIKAAVAPLTNSYSTYSSYSDYSSPISNDNNNNNNNNNNINNENVKKGEGSLLLENLLNNSRNQLKFRWNEELHDIYELYENSSPYEQIYQFRQLYKLSKRFQKVLFPLPLLIYYLSIFYK